MIPPTPDPTPALRCGLAVFPIPPGHKHPAPGWREAITTDRAGLHAWPTGANVGVACRASRIVGLDLDTRLGEPNGLATLEWLAQRHGQPWPDTFTVATPSGGRHLYFRAPESGTFLSSSTRLPGIDVRAPDRRTGGYLVGPSSVVRGARYTIVRDVSVACLPPWLARLLDASRSLRLA